MKLSIIIPTYNEAANIEKMLTHLSNCSCVGECEVIIVDANSTDNTVELANNYKVKIYTTEHKSRAIQMNLGASKATGTVLYFVHADVAVHHHFCSHIKAAIQSGKHFGCYRYQFDSTNKLLKFNGYMTKYNSVWAGGGDQTLFITKEKFEALNGFDNSLLIMEDFDLVKRAKKMGLNFTILPYTIKVSARKYEKNSWLRVQAANTVIVIAWKMGASQQWLKTKYSKLLR